MFIDTAEIKVEAGKGGNGMVAFRREKYVPKGGPAGGNGGNGGNVYFQTDYNLLTLLDFRYNLKYKAEDGVIGGNSRKDGRCGKDIIIRVPVGTILKDKDTGETLADLDQPNMKLMIARGGKGGRGNSNFATPTQQTPRWAEPGRPGEWFNLVLELKLIADIGLVGFPNAGKSTLISTISEAKPKIADYPFTTLEPNLGIVRYKDYNSFVVADIPGIIEGASEGKGLGLKFLRHIERTRILLFLIDSTSESYQKQYTILNNELKKYSSELAGKERIIAISKADLLSDADLAKAKKKKIRGYSSPLVVFSSATGYGVEELTNILWKKIAAANEE